MSRGDEWALCEQAISLVPPTKLVRVLEAVGWTVLILGTAGTLWVVVSSLGHGWGWSAVRGAVVLAGLVFTIRQSIRYGGFYRWSRMRYCLRNWWTGPATLSSDDTAIALQVQGSTTRVAWADVDEARITKDFVWLGRFSGDSRWVWAPLEAFSRETPLDLVLDSVRARGGRVVDLREACLTSASS
ncbi:MAG: hypothetical protein U1E29_13015 [Coriobacteriia bacterium]|nr:hypothetical protein [Coriobacteriia bacterium]